MSPQVVDWTALAMVLSGGTAAGMIFMAGLCRRQRAVVAEAVARLDAMAGRVARLEAQTPEPPPAITAPTPTSAGPSRTPRRRAEAGKATAVAGPTLIVVPNLAATAVDRHAESVMAEASAELGQRFGAIWELADAGAPAESIARATGHPIGQVELILGLRRQLAASAGPPGPGGPIAS
jgi:hypothetical protein